MGRVVVSEFVTLDGVFEDPGGSEGIEGGGWAFKAQRGDKFNAMPKYVVSSTLQSADWNNSHILRGELSEEVSRLKDQIAGDILVAGSGTLVQGLLGADLVDELRLMVFPFVVGQGRRLFDGAGPAQLRLTEAGQAGDTATLVYVR
jgi:dihydrofolate reductase